MHFAVRANKQLSSEFELPQSKANVWMYCFSLWCESVSMRVRVLSRIARQPRVERSSDKWRQSSETRWPWIKLRWKKCFSLNVKQVQLQINGWIVMHIHWTINLWHPRTIWLHFASLIPGNKGSQEMRQRGRSKRKKSRSWDLIYEFNPTLCLSWMKFLWSNEIQWTQTCPKTVRNTCHQVQLSYRYYWTVWFGRRHVWRQIWLS